jgi:hypothetical protein
LRQARRQRCHVQSAGSYGRWHRYSSALQSRTIRLKPDQGRRSIRRSIRLNLLNRNLPLALDLQLLCTSPPSATTKPLGRAASAQRLLGGGWGRRSYLARSSIRRAFRCSPFYQMPTLADIARLSTEEAAVVRVALPLRPLPGSLLFCGRQPGRCPPGLYLLTAIGGLHLTGYRAMPLRSCCMVPSTRCAAPLAATPPAPSRWLFSTRRCFRMRRRRD